MFNVDSPHEELHPLMLVCSLKGSTLDSACRCGMGVVLTHPVAMRRGCVLGALEHRHMCGGQVTAPGRAGVLQHRPDELFVQRNLGFFLMAECGGGQGLHHIQPRPGPSDDLLAVRPEGHTSVPSQTQYLGRWTDRDGSASQGN